MKAFENEEARLAKLTDIKQALEALIAVVPQARVIKAGVNANAAEQYDLSLLTEFDTWDDLHAYAVHPKHVAVSCVIREVLEARACVDSEF